MKTENYPHLKFIERYNISIDDDKISKEIKTQISEFDTLYKRSKEISNDEYDAISKPKMEKLSTVIYENLVDIFDKEAEEEKVEKEEKAEKKEAEKKEKIEKKEEVPSNLTSEQKIEIISKLFNSGKTQITEEELEKEGICAWSDLGFTATTMGPFKLSKKLFSDLWTIEKTNE